MSANAIRLYFGYFVLFVGTWVIAAAPIYLGNDGQVRYESLDTFLRTGTLDRSKYSHYGPLAAVPLWYLGEAIGLTQETVWVFNRVVFLAGLVGLWIVLRPVLSLRERVRFAAFLLFGSMFPWHVMGFFAEVFHAVFVGLGLALLAVRRDWWTALGAVLVVWGTANIPASAVGLALAACVLVWHRHRLRYLLLPVAAAGLILFENYIRRGDLFADGYAGEAGYRTVLPYSAQPGFSYPLFFGLLSVLFSFGKGLIFFTPGLFARYPDNALASLPRGEDGERSEPGEGSEAKSRLVYRVWLAVVIGLVLVYARWWAWYGGAVWGPRFFLFASLPASLVLARWTAHPEGHSTCSNVLVLVAVALSCWVGVNGIVYSVHGSAPYWADDFALEYVTWYVPEISVLWRPFVVPMSLDWKDFARLAAFALGFAYLAWPVVRVVAIRAAHGIASLWHAARSGERWRI
ncbi:MAG: hypothetical protein L0241_15205 [Planctomycetia bacterium]|nr:hypothetical protein [Planctomycetia bacterium]